MNVVQETLGFRRAGLSPALSLLMSAFALLIPPATLTGHLHRPTERSPTMQYIPEDIRIRIFGAQFEPRYIFRAGRLDQ
jgi:hypothetical protein